MGGVDSAGCLRGVGSQGRCQWKWSIYVCVRVGMCDLRSGNFTQEGGLRGLYRQWESKAFKQKRKVRPHLGFRKVFLEWVEKGRD